MCPIADATGATHIAASFAEWAATKLLVTHKVRRWDQDRSEMPLGLEADVCPEQVAARWVPPLSAHEELQRQPGPSCAAQGCVTPVPGVPAGYAEATDLLTQGVALG